MKYLGVCAAILLFASAAFAVTPRPAQMPWTTFSGEMTKAYQGNPNMVMCPKGSVIIMWFTYQDGEYLMAASENSSYVAFAYDPDAKNENSMVTEIGIGYIDPDKYDTIPPLVWEPYSKERHENVCSLIFPLVS